MNLFEYLTTYDEFPYGDEDDTELEILHLELCDTEEEQLEDLQYLKESEGDEKFELFREYCIACKVLPNLFSSDGTGIGDQMIKQY